MRLIPSKPGILVGSVLLSGLLGVIPEHPAGAEVSAPEAVSSSLPSQADPLKELIQLCEPPGATPRSNAQIQECYARHLFEIMQAQGATVGMLTLYQLAGASSGFSGLCHVTAHYLGEALYDQVGNMSEAMALCRDGCAYACQHAVLNSYLRALPQGAAPDVGRLCPPSPEHRFSVKHWQCTHGVGHGLAHYYHDLTQGLSACKGFPVRWEQRNCDQGLFMEYANEVVRTPARLSNPVDYLSPCEAGEPHQRYDCYHYLISLVHWASGGSVPATFAACEKTRSTDKSGCYSGIGRGLFGQYIEREDELIRVCRSGDDAYATDCDLGFLGVLVNFTSLDRGFGFCAKLSEEARIRCSEKMGWIVRLYRPTKEAIQAECRKAGDPRYIQTCLDAKLNTGE